jgi:hypothetical protein
LALEAGLARLDPVHGLLAPHLRDAAWPALTWINAGIAGSVDERSVGTTGSFAGQGR